MVVDHLADRCPLLIRLTGTVLTPRLLSDAHRRPLAGGGVFAAGRLVMACCLSAGRPTFQAAVLFSTACFDGCQSIGHLPAGKVSDYSAASLGIIAAMRGAAGKNNYFSARSGNSLGIASIAQCCWLVRP